MEILNHFYRWELILDLVWLVFLLLLLRHFLRDLRALKYASHWLKTSGQITECELAEQQGTYWPEVTYCYKVNDKEYTGNYLFLDTSNNNPHSKYARNLAYEITLAFKQGREVDVYYDPNKPHMSALSVKIPPKLYLVIALVSSLLVIHLIIIGCRALAS